MRTIDPELECCKSCLTADQVLLQPSILTANCPCTAGAVCFLLPALPQSYVGHAPCPPACISPSQHAQHPDHLSSCRNSCAEQKQPSSLLRPSQASSATAYHASAHLLSTSNTVIQICQLLQRGHNCFAIVLDFGDQGVPTQVQAPQVWKLLDGVQDLRIFQLIVLQVQCL